MSENISIDLKTDYLANKPQREVPEGAYGANYVDRLSEIDQRLRSMVEQSTHAIHMLDYGYLHNINYDSPVEDVNDLEHQATEQAIDLFNSQRESLKDIYQNPNENPLVSLVARTSELYMLSQAYSIGADEWVFKSNDYDLCEKYPKLFEQYDDLDSEPEDSIDPTIESLKHRYHRYNSVETVKDIYDALDKYGLLQMVEEDLGFDIRELSGEAMELFGDFLVNSTSARYERLVETISKFQGQTKVDIAEVFLATEFGDELGEAILDICEFCDEDQSRQILDGVNTFRQVMPKVEELFSRFDRELAHQTSQAFIKRTSEVLMCASQVAKYGFAEATMYNGEKVRIDNLDEIIASLSLLNQALTTTVESVYTMQADRISEQDDQVSYWFDDGRVMLQIREHGSVDTDPRYSFDGEARINLLFNPNEPISELVSEASRQQALSIRLDREGIIRDVNNNYISSDPEIEKGVLSLDIGSIYGEPDNPNTRVGRILAIGNALISSRRSETPHFTHVRETFDSKYGVDTEFARIAHNFRRRLDFVNRHVVQN